jgi:cellulose synthase/poly-beta-1,6-N-acetylglucosamine synthase-like glycosyltransferase
MAPLKNLILPRWHNSRPGERSNSGTSPLAAIKRPFDALQGFMLRFSEWLIDWTPFTLVTTYYIVSTAIYVFCSYRQITVFYFFYMCTNLYIAMTCVIEAFLAVTPIREARKEALKVEGNGQRFPTPDAELPMLDLLIVAYLPNEKEIVKDQVQYALDELAYPKTKIRVNLLYNTPKPMEPLETELHAMTKQYLELRVIKVPESKSKADNLNHFLTLETDAEIISIFDCDHFPHPHNPRWAAERFVADPTIDIIQGRCVVYNTNESFYAKMIAIEFDKIYATSHPGRSRMFGFGLFCGSNGYWRAGVLRQIKMDETMLTEDIDSGLRAYAQNKKTIHDLNVISYEMTPNTFAAFWKQRLRWAQGWTQASYRHMPLVWNQPPSGKRGLDQRFGVLSLLLIREMSYYLVTQHTCLILSFVITGFPTSPAKLVRLVFFQYPMAQWFLFST